MAHRDETEMVMVEQTTVFLVCDGCANDIGLANLDTEYWTLRLEVMRPHGPNVPSSRMPRAVVCESCARKEAAAYGLQLPSAKELDALALK